MLKLLEHLQRRRIARRLHQYHIPFRLWQQVRATPLISRFNRAEQHRLRLLASRLLAEKVIVGAGIALTPFQKAYIATEACVPILNLPDDLDWYDNWTQLTVRPTPWQMPLQGPVTGPLTEQRTVTLAGVTSLQWPVVIDWQSARPHPLGHHAHQVIIHELAHKIDLQVDDAANGFPPLHRDMNGQAWHAAFSNAFAALQKCVRRPRCHPPINGYAATNPGEFFAVTTEYFFAAPVTLHTAYPAAYEQLRQFYRQDPLQRFKRGLP